VDVTFDGRVISLPEGENLAAALLMAGVTPFRHTPVSGAPRAPFCMMGACYDCLIEIDGVTRQACMMQVRAGLELHMPHGATP
jgi:predicted molibdopterin-dependent oxidoreductase YjgC